MVCTISDPVEVVLALIEHGLHYLGSSGSGTHFNRTWFGVSLGYWRLRFSVGGPWEEVTERSSVRGTGGVSCSVLLFFTLNFPHLVELRPCGLIISLCAANIESSYSAISSLDHCS